MTWIIIITIFIALGVYGSMLDKKTEKLEKELEENLYQNGVERHSKIPLGKYVGGHPEIDDVIPRIYSFKHGKELQLFVKRIGNDNEQSSLELICLGVIPIENISEILIEDNSSIEKKVTLGRVLLVGVFALMWKKNKKNEDAFLNIKWNDGKYSHETLFQYEEKNAFQVANKVRNLLIKQTRN